MLVCGGNIALTPRFDSAAIISRLPPSTVVMDAPTFCTRHLADAYFMRATCKDMGLFVPGSVTLLAETHTAFKAWTGHQILERYGMTQANMSTPNPYDGERRQLQREFVFVLALVGQCGNGLQQAGCDDECYAGRFASPKGFACKKGRRDGPDHHFRHEHQSGNARV
mgnify:CR=1 FL=1